MTFLEDWDQMIADARTSGTAAFELYGKRDGIGQFIRVPGSNWIAMKVTARTMHPAFMAQPMPKYDPQRDLVRPGA